GLTSGPQSSGSVAASAARRASAAGSSSLPPSSISTARPRASSAVAAATPAGPEPTTTSAASVTAEDEDVAVPQGAGEAVRHLQRRIRRRRVIAGIESLAEPGIGCVLRDVALHPGGEAGDDKDGAGGGHRGAVFVVGIDDRPVGAVIGKVLSRVAE